MEEKDKRTRYKGTQALTVYNTFILKIFEANVAIVLDVGKLDAYF